MESSLLEAVHDVADSSVEGRDGGCSVEMTPGDTDSLVHVKIPLRRLHNWAMGGLKGNIEEHWRAGVMALYSLHRFSELVELEITNNASDLSSLLPGYQLSGELSLALV